MKLNSLKSKVWLYLTFFSISILAFLWFFQVLFLNKFYEYSKVNELNNAVKLINDSYKDNSLYDNVDLYSKDNGICIQIMTDNKLIYDSQSFNRGCIPNDFNYKEAFINSLLDQQTYKLINNRFNNEVLIRAIKLNTNTYAFLSSSLQPLDNAIKILKNQLIIVTFLVLILSFIVGYFISKKISNPIEKINKSAKKMGKGEYEDTLFYIDEDISELNELVNTLNDTNNQLSKTEDLQRELMANVSHDLKTPLTMIKAYAEMVRDLTYKNKNKREENLNIIIEETDRLNLLVNDIIDLSKEKANVNKLNLEKFDLTELINTILKRFNIMDVNLIFNSTKELFVYADKLRIEQVIYNLISNAINYTGEDKIVYINLTELDRIVHVEIKDTGSGIDEEDLKLIWKKYYKVDKKYKREKKGSGIGLSIVESILKRHNFNYGVTSVKNVGTTFFFDIDKC